MVGNQGFLDEGIVGDQPQAKRCGALGDRTRHPAERDEAEGLPHQPRDLQELRPALGQRPLRTILSCSTSRRNPDSSSIMAWSATSSMKVSGTLVTGMPRAVAAFTSTLSTPTVPSVITLQFSSASMTALLIRMPLA